MIIMGTTAKKKKDARRLTETVLKKPMFLDCNCEMRQIRTKRLLSTSNKWVWRKGRIHLYKEICSSVRVINWSFYKLTYETKIHISALCFRTYYTTVYFLTCKTYIYICHSTTGSMAASLQVIVGIRKKIVYSVYKMRRDMKPQNHFIKNFEVLQINLCLGAHICLKLYSFKLFLTSFLKVNVALNFA